MAIQSLSKLVKSLPDYFLRVYRSYIINKQKVTLHKGRDQVLSKKTILASDIYYDIVKHTLFKS